MNAEELKIVLDDHAKWLREERDGNRAILSGADLSRANLSGANLYGADLRWADLSGADLSRAYLYGANLYGANLGDHLIRTWSFVEYNCQYINGRLKIGCKEHTTYEWASFTEAQIRKMDGEKAVKFWRSVDFRCMLMVCQELDKQLKERSK